MPYNKPWIVFSTFSIITFQVLLFSFLTITQKNGSMENRVGLSINQADR